jgi:hypothetical protein
MPYSLDFTRKGKDYHYDLTSNDILNLLRATYKEGKQKEAVAYTLLNRFAWIYPSKEYDSLSSFITAYAQPLNPKWFPTGSAHLASVKQIKSKYSGAELQKRLDYAKKLANQRVLNSTMSIDKIPETTTKVVYGILNGEIKNPVKGSMHFRASTAAQSDSQNTALIKQREFASNRSDIGKAIVYSDATAGNNWFFTSPDSDNFVLHINRNNKVMEAGIGFPGYFIIIGLVGYLLMKFTRK